MLLLWPPWCLAPRRADGGVCKNGFVMQMTSDLIDQKIDRPAHFDMSCLGAASLAGLALGMCAFPEVGACLLTILMIAFFLAKHRIALWVQEASASGKVHSHTQADCSQTPVTCRCVAVPFPSFLHSFSQRTSWWGHSSLSCLLSKVGSLYKLSGWQ
jgi:hypothetical protein